MPNHILFDHLMPGERLLEEDESRQDSAFFPLQHTEAVMRAPGANMIETMQQKEGPTFRPFFPEDDVPLFRTFEAGFMGTGIPQGIYNALAADPIPDRFDPKYNFVPHLKNHPDPEIQAMLLEIMGTPGNPVAEEFFARVTDVESGYSAEKTEALLKQMMEARKRFANLTGNGTGWAIGATVLGLAPEVLMAIGVGVWAGGAGSIPLVGAVFFNRANNVRRLVAATRVGAEAAALSAGERWIHSFTDPLVTDDEIEFAGLIGAGVGGVLGGAFPKAVGRVHFKGSRGVLDDEARLYGPGGQRTSMDVPEALEESGFLRDGSGSAGAAASPGRFADEPQGIVTPAKGSRGIMDRVFQYLPRRGGFIRNTKRIITSIGHVGKSMGAKYQAHGLSRAYTNFGKLVKLRGVNESELGGLHPSFESAQTIKSGLDEMRQIQQESAVEMYNEMVSDVFGAGRLKQIAENQEFGSFGGFHLNRDEWSVITGRYSEAFHKATVNDARVWGSFKSRFSDEQLEKLNPWVKKYADAEDVYWTRAGKRMVDSGLLDEDELIPGYRPQLANRRAMEANRNEATMWIVKTWHKLPDMEWVAERGYRIKGPEGELLEIAEETWDDFLKAFPDEALDIMDDWNIAMKNALLDEHELAVTAAQRATVEAGEENLDTLSKKLRKARDASQEKLSTLNKAHRLEKNAAARDKLNTKIASTEVLLKKRNAKLERANDAWGHAEKIDDMIKQFGAKAQKRTRRVVKKKLTTALKKEAAAVARLNPYERAQQLVRTYIDGKDPFALLDTDMLAFTSRAKNRTMNFGEERYSDEYMKFFTTNDMDLRIGHMGSVGPQIALRERWPELAAQGKKFDMDALEREFFTEIDQDMARLGSMTKGDARAYEKGADEMRKLFKSLMNEFTHKDLVLMNQISGGSMDIANIASSVAVSALLGRLFFSLLGDVGVMAGAGGSLGTGFAVGWRGTGRKLVKEMYDKGQGELALLAEGPNVKGMSRFHATAGLASEEMDVAGGVLRKFSRVTKQIAVIQGWANLMHVWNRTVRRGFGLDFMRQLHRDTLDYASLPASRKTFYAGLGASESRMKKLGTLLETKGMKIHNGKLTIPDAGKWDADMLSLYHRIIREAGDEAMIDPGIGDRGAFLRTTALGRLIGLFQGFMITAGERFVTPMIQRGVLYPTDIQPYAAAIIAYNMSIMGDGLRMYTAGRGSEWYDNWDTVEGTRDNLTVGLLRSPLVVGMAGIIAETTTNMFGRQGNDALEALGAPRLIPQARTRYREAQGFEPFLGPAFGVAQQAQKAARQAADNDWERALTSAGRLLPIYNTVLVRTAQEMMFGND